MVIKIMSIKNPVFGGVLLLSAFSQVAGATETVPSQPETIPGIATPDQAVRQMATNVVSASRSAPALSNIARPTGSPTNNSANRQISSIPFAGSGLPDPSRVLSSCPSNVCGFVATQPPVTLGTVSPTGISKIEQNRQTNSGKISINPVAIPQTSITPNDRITTAATLSLSTEPGLSKDVAFSQPALQPFGSVASASASKLAQQPAIASTSIAPTVAATPKSINVGNFQSQISSFTGQLVANSWKLITVLPKPQLDNSLLNIGNSPRAEASSFTPRLTLGPVVDATFQKTNFSLATPSLFTPKDSAVKSAPVKLPLNPAGFLAKPWNDSSAMKFSTSNSFPILNSFETSLKPFNIMNFLATVNTKTLSSDSLISLSVGLTPTR
jgi:hypothetical protein